MAREPLKVSCYLLKEGSQDKNPIELTEDDYTPWDEVPEEQKARQLEIWSERLSRSMTAYFRRHPEEYAKL